VARNKVLRSSQGKSLNKNMPLCPFLAAPDIGALEQSSTVGGIAICEKGPPNPNMWAFAGLFAPSRPGTHAMTDYHMYFIVVCLSFRVRGHMFWNMVGRTTEGAAIEYATLYYSLDGFCHVAPGTPAMVMPRYCTAAPPPFLAADHM
jgi:hypothetical protein